MHGFGTRGRAVPWSRSSLSLHASRCQAGAPPSYFLVPYPAALSSGLLQSGRKHSGPLWSPWAQRTVYFPPHPAAGAARGGCSPPQNTSRGPRQRQRCNRGPSRSSATSSTATCSIREPADGGLQGSRQISEWRVREEASVQFRVSFDFNVSYPSC